jgi:glutamine cyclotransferase
MPLSCFTQGLELVNSTHVLLSCGGFGDSKLVLIGGFDDDEGLSHEVVFRGSDADFFEGIVVTDDRVFISTWRNGKIIELTRNWQPVGTISYPREGWGLSRDPSSGVFYSTGGSSKLYSLDPSRSMQTVRECDIRVSHDGSGSVPANYINELEYYEGLLYGNLFISNTYSGVPNYIVAINPSTCYIERIVALFNLQDAGYKDPNQVMNGISRMPGNTGDFLVTGKKWSLIHRIRVVETPSTTYSPQWTTYNITQFLSASLRFR